MRNIQLFTLIVLSLLSTTISATTISFHDGNFESAKEKALVEGKMVLLNFYAAWCMPCKWMEETTFSDPDISAKINENFIAVKVNVDDFDGYALKDHFGVKILPTVLIFTGDGTMIERIEETLPPSKMDEILDRSLTSKKPRTNRPNLSPKEVVATQPREAKPFEISTARTSYKLQLGLFRSYENTLNFYEDLVSTLDQPIIILHDLKGNNVVYRVLVGTFASTTDANDYKKTLQEQYGIRSHLYL